MFGGTVESGEVELLFCGVEIEHQIEHHLLYLVGTAVRFVYFIDYHYGFKSQLYGFLQHETSLGHRSFECVDQEQAAVGHVEHTFYLAAEIGVPGGVDYVDFISFIVDGNVFRQDCYTAFALQIVVVKN